MKTITTVRQALIIVLLAVIAAGCASPGPDEFQLAHNCMVEEQAREKEVNETVAEILRVDREKRHNYVANHPGLSEKIKMAILSDRYPRWCLGMSPDDLRAAVGDPDKINRHVSTYGTTEQWVHRGYYFYFENAVLTSWQE